MIKPYLYAEISPNTLDIHKILSECKIENTGGMVVFYGIVRKKNKGKNVKHLLYETHPLLAKKEMEKILSKSIEKWPLLNAVAIHRSGLVKINETAVIIITSSEHRAEAYSANMYIIDHLKKNVPIWKKEFFTDGTYSWSSNCKC